MNGDSLTNKHLIYKSLTSDSTCGSLVIERVASSDGMGAAGDLSDSLALPGTSMTSDASSL